MCFALSFKAHIVLQKYKIFLKAQNKKPYQFVGQARTTPEIPRNYFLVHLDELLRLDFSAPNIWYESGFERRKTESNRY